MVQLNIGNQIKVPINHKLKMIKDFIFSLSKYLLTYFSKYYIDIIFQPIEFKDIMTIQNSFDLKASTPVSNFNDLK